MNGEGAAQRPAGGPAQTKQRAATRRAGEEGRERAGDRHSLSTTVPFRLLAKCSKPACRGPPFQLFGPLILIAHERGQLLWIEEIQGYVKGEPFF